MKQPPAIGRMIHVLTNGTEDDPHRLVPGVIVTLSPQPGRVGACLFCGPHHQQHGFNQGELEVGTAWRYLDRGTGVNQWEYPALSSSGVNLATLVDSRINERIHELQKLSRRKVIVKHVDKR